mgnify:CR=1 FL=1
MQFTTVKRAVKAAHVDGFDADRAPEIEQVHGQVTFYPMMGDGDSVQVQTVDGPVTVVLTPITVRISDGLVMHRGGVGVQLFAGGDGCEPSLIRWRARFTNLQSQGVPLKLRDVIFDAIPGGEVDLTTAAPLANAPEPIVRGPQGVSVDTLVVEGGDLVVWGRSESGRQVLSRIPMADVTREAAEAASAATIAKVKSTLDKKADADTVSALSDTVAGKADTATVTQSLAGVEKSLATKAAKAHTHVSADVTDAKSTPTAGVLVKYDKDGLFTVGAPKIAAHPVTKTYVDDALGKKADKTTLTNINIDPTPYDPKRKVIYNKDEAPVEVSNLAQHVPDWAPRTFGLWSATLGMEAFAAGDLAVALGAFANAESGLSAAVGPLAVVDGTGALAVGPYTRVSGNYSVAIGWGASAFGQYAIALGSKDHTVTVAGKLVVQEPTAGDHATTKKYVDTSLAKKADTAHTHTIANVTGLQAALAGKAATSHKHSISDVTGLHAEISARPNGWIIRAASQLSATEKKARAGDLIHVVETGETWEVT